MVSLFYASLSLAISSLTDRKGFASAGIVLLAIMTQVIGAVLGTENGRLVKPGALISVSVSPVELVQRIFDSYSEIDASTLLVAAVVVGVIVVSLAVLFGRYRSLEVTR